MTTSSCCCFHIRTCAIIVAVFGIVGSVFELIAGLKSETQGIQMIVLGTISLISFIYVLVGVVKERPGYLLPAQVLVICNIVLRIIGAVLMVIILALALNAAKDDKAKNVLITLIITLCVISVLQTLCLIFGLVVIRRMYKYLLGTASTAVQYPYGQ